MDKALLDTDIFSDDQAHYQRIQALGYSLKLDNWRYPPERTARARAGATAYAARM
jgi:hypothetical protein